MRLAVAVVLVIIACGPAWAACDVASMGAVGDGVTDDTAAFNACKTALSGKIGGRIVIPASGAVYCVREFVNDGLRLSGEAQGGIVINGTVPGPGTVGRGVFLSACGQDKFVVKLDANFAAIDHIAICGHGMDGSMTSCAPNPNGFSATVSALISTDNANECSIEYVSVYGGMHAYEHHAGECKIDKLFPAYSYGSANIYVSGTNHSGTWTSAGGWFYHVSPDQWSFPIQHPGFKIEYGNWSAGHAYSVGMVVKIVCQDGKPYVIQASTAGTSGTAPPTCANYALPISDNSVTWYLVHPDPFYHWQFDTMTREVYIKHSDTGGGTAGFAMTSMLSANPNLAPFFIACDRCNGGGGYLANFYGHDGGNLMLTNVQTGGCIEDGCSNYRFVGNFQGNVTIQGGYSRDSQLGALINKGSRFLITNVDLGGNGNGAAQITGTASHVIINGNDLTGAAGGTPYGVFMSTTGDYLNIVNNICGGNPVCVNDQSPAPHKVISGNN